MKEFCKTFVALWDQRQMFTEQILEAFFPIFF